MYISIINIDVQKDNYILLINKLDNFIRKFYFNKFLRGIIYTTALLFAFFLIIALAEYAFYFSPLVRKFMFYGFISLSLFAFSYFLFVPLAKIKRLGKTINHFQAAEIIGNHFTNVKDKLLNILQLKNAEVSLEQAALIEASINQKSLELKPIPFSSAINLKENKNYLKYAVPPLLLFFALLFMKPNVIKESANRLIKNDISFERPIPFSFIINEDSLSALQFEDFYLNIKIDGKEIPKEIYLYRKNSENDFVKTIPQKLNNTNYLYIFSNLQENMIFYFEAGGFKSKEYVLDISQKPLISNFKIELNYPKYLNKKKFTLKNTGDISAPFGTQARWVFETVATENVVMKFSDKEIILEAQNKNKFIFSKTLKTNEKYTVETVNKNIAKQDAVQFDISVVYDEYPKITVAENIDSTNKDVYFYIGEISDDYGLTKLTFNYQISSSTNFDNEVIRKDIAFERSTISEFSYYWDIKEFDLKPGDKLSYYFQVWDNDGVNGAKSSKSKWLTIKIPSIDEYENKSEKELDELKKDLIKSIAKTQELQQKLKEFKQKALNKKELSWEDKKKMKEMLEEQKKLQENISKLNEKLKENIKEQSEFKEVKPEIAKKQEQLQKLFDEVLDEEMKALIEKYQEMLEKLDKEESIEQVEEMQVTDEELEKELDRMLELLKQLEFEQKLEETKDKLEKLAEKQEELANDENKTSEEKKEEQNEINEEFEKLKEELDKLEELDKELGDKMDMDELKEDAEKTSDEMIKALEELSKNKKSKASKSQKSASQKMQDMAKKMSDMQMQMQSQSLEEDMESLRHLLENLIALSFEEERLLDEFKTTTINTSKYLSLVQEQHKLILDSEHVEDSLFALAKRVIEIESFITDKIFDINRNLNEAVKYLEDRKVYKAVVNQQYVMTAYNDLALMLSEVLQQMQQQMAQQMEGNQSCEKPGNGKPKAAKLPSLKQMQKQLSDQISKMGEKMKSGEGGKSEKKSGESKELAKMAAKQQAIREALQKIKDGDKKGKDGKGSLGDLQKIIDEMKQNESDIVNKNLTSEITKRQQDILTRLLEAENAERQRDEKEERKSESATNLEKTIPPALKEYLKKRKKSLDLYKSLPINLKPFYRNISEKYFKNSINKK